MNTKTSKSSSRSLNHRLTARTWLGLAAVALVALLIDATLIEPYRIQVTHYQLRAAIDAPLKVAQLTDLHTHGLGRRERQMIAILAAEKPDVIVITGDSLGGYGGTYQEDAEVYKQLHAPLGVWFVRGNWENDRPYRPFRREREFYESAGVHLLVNSNAELRPDIWLIGLNDPSSGVVRLDQAMAEVPGGI